MEKLPLESWGHCGYSVDMVETKSHNVRVPDGIWDAAAEAARANGETLAVVIRKALIEYVRENQS